MDDQIGVAPDRRGEVQVVGRGEPEVADVHHVVGRLLERAEQLERQRLLGRMPLQLVEHPLQSLGRARLVEVDRDAVIFGQRRELLEPRAVGGVVDAPEGVVAALLKAAGDRLVGGQHELLDHRVGLPLARIAARLADGAHQARIVAIELHERLGEIEVERPAGEPRHAQLPRQRVHRPQRRQKRLVLLPLAARVAPQRRRHARVVEPRLRVDHRRHEVAVDDVGLPIEIDPHHHRQPVLLGDQRAQPRRERLGQHRDRPARQVDAAAAPERLVVERRPLPHVVRDVGHRDPEARPAVRQLLQRHRVVEVARRLGIDRREGDLAQIRPVDAIGERDRVAEGGGDPLDLVGELLLDVGAGEHLLDLRARVVGVTQHLQHLRLDRPVGDVGVAGDLGDHGDPVARLGDRPAQRHQAGDARIVGLQHLVLPAPHQLAGDLGAAAREHAGHPTLDPSDAGPGLDLDGVAVHRRPAVAGRDVHVLGFVVGDDEAVPDGVNLDFSGQRTDREARKCRAHL